MFENNSDKQPDVDFISLDGDDMDFLDAQKKIDMLEAYEYYLSESCPVSNMLNNAISQYPDLETVFEMLLSGILSDIQTEWTKKEIMECALEVLKRELSGADV